VSTYGKPLLLLFLIGRIDWLKEQTPLGRPRFFFCLGQPYWVDREKDRKYRHCCTAVENSPSREDMRPLKAPFSSYSFPYGTQLSNSTRQFRASCFIVTIGKKAIVESYRA
jgi:hypothetical protein